MKKHSKNLIAGISVLLLALSIIPLLALAPYCRPCADDFGYGGPVYYAIKNGGGVFAVINAVIENIRYSYLNWQGTFTSVLFFSLQPDAFFEGFYFITPIVMLTAIILSIYLLLGTVNILSPYGRVIIGSVISFLAVQFLPSSADGIYWWNGASHYILCWLLLILVLTAQVRILRQKERKKTFALFVILTAFCGFLAGGSNYSTALVCAVISCLVSVYSIISKKDQKITGACWAVTAFTIVGLVINMLAPGNLVRQSGFEKMNPVSAVLLSFSEAFGAVLEFTDLTIICALLFCIPVFLISLKKKDYTFPCPIGVLLGTFCIFASFYTPPLYAMGLCDVPRMNNLFFLAYLVWIFGNCFYISGWVFCKLKKRESIRFLKIALIFGGLVFLIVTIGETKHSNSYLAYADLKSDTPKAYVAEISARKLAEKDKEFVPISQFPASFPPAKSFTWSPNLFVDQKASNLAIYRACGGEVTFVGLWDALDYFKCTESLTEKDFSKVFYIDQKVCVPLKEVTEKTGRTISYDILCDTIYITDK